MATKHEERPHHREGHHEEHHDAKAEAPILTVTDANGSASAADKEFYRRKNHGGTGA